MIGSVIPGQVSLLLYKIAEQTRGSKPVFFYGLCLRVPVFGSLKDGTCKPNAPSKWVLIGVSNSIRKVKKDGRWFGKMCWACSHVDFLQEKAR